MSYETTLTCLECGHANPVGRTQCEACGAWVPQTAEARSIAHGAESEAQASPLVEEELAEVATRPTGITVLAVLDLVGSGFSALALAALATSASLSGDFGGMALLYLLIAIGYGVLGWGMWTLRSWARIFHIVASAIGLLGFPVGTIINGVIIYYLTRPHVGLAFSAKR